MSPKTKLISSVLALATTGLMTFGTTAGAVTAKTATDPTIGITYQSQVQSNGWQSIVSGGTAGTVGKSLRLETLRINLTGAPKDAIISYQAQIQKLGWQAGAKNGGASGTVGKGLRMEAVRISINGLDGYTVQYRAYVQKTGWQAWQTTSNGTDLGKAAYTGTVGKALRMEAIQIKLVKLPVIQSVNAIEIATVAGVAPVLPATVQATMSDGAKKTVAVTWDAVAAEKYAASGTFSVNGTIQGTTVKAVANVTVAALAVASVQPIDVSTPAGVAPILPTTVTATMSDTTTKQETVTWDAVDPASYAAAGSLTVNGTIADTTIKAVANVTVGTPVVASVAPESVTTPAGIAPTLPATVTATMSDSTTQQVNVTWDAVDAARYAAAGSFTVNGTIADTTIKAVANVTVN